MAIESVGWLREDDLPLMEQLGRRVHGSAAWTEREWKACLQDRDVNGRVLLTGLSGRDTPTPQAGILFSRKVLTVRIHTIAYTDLERAGQLIAHTQRRFIRVHYAVPDTHLEMHLLLSRLGFFCVSAYQTGYAEHIYEFEFDSRGVGR